MLVSALDPCRILEIKNFFNCKSFEYFEVSSKWRITISKIIINWCCNYLTDIRKGYPWLSFIFQFLNIKFKENSFFIVRLFWSVWPCELGLSEEKCAVRNHKNRFLLAGSLGWYSCALQSIENMLYYFLLLCWAIGNWFSQTIYMWRMASFY